jgi:hypothetical protein
MLTESETTFRSSNKMKIATSKTIIITTRGGQKRVVPYFTRLRGTLFCPTSSITTEMASPRKIQKRV